MSNFLFPEFEKDGLSASVIIDGVTLVENFLSSEELDNILNIIDQTPEDDWKIEYLGNLQRFCMEKFGRDDVDNLVAEGKFEITQNWSDKNLNIRNYPIYEIIHSRLDTLVQKADDSLELSGLATIQRMQSGVELKPHTDQHTDPSIRYATILYLNDDYVDGELFFSNKGLDVRPKRGSLIVFPGNEEFDHGVRHVGDGPIRYVIVGFVKVKNFYENNKY
jgi:hypothetical protein